MARGHPDEGAPVFHQVDAALATLITDEALGEAGVAIAFDVPNRPWFAAVQAPTVNAFLYDVRENASRRDVMHEPVLDEQGRVVGRKPPPPRYDLYYLLSVWGVPDPALEHHVMASVLAALARFDVFPADRVPEELRGLGLWHLNVANGPKRMMPGNFGGEMKLQAEVAVTVPLPTRVTAPTAPAVHRPMDVRMSGAGGQRETVTGRPPAAGPPAAAPPAGPGGPGAPAGVPR
ncbi:Pvc16 family protein, partial [Angustibacter speluncae]